MTQASFVFKQRKIGLHVSMHSSSHIYMYRKFPFSRSFPFCAFAKIHLILFEMFVRCLYFDQITKVSAYTKSHPSVIVCGHYIPSIAPAYLFQSLRISWKHTKPLWALLSRVLTVQPQPRFQQH